MSLFMHCKCTLAAWKHKYDSVKHQFVNIWMYSISCFREEQASMTVECIVLVFELLQTLPEVSPMTWGYPRSINQEGQSMEQVNKFRQPLEGPGPFCRISGSNKKGIVYFKNHLRKISYIFPCLALYSIS